MRRRNFVFLSLILLLAGTYGIAQREVVTTSHRAEAQQVERTFNVEAIIKDAQRKIASRDWEEARAKLAEASSHCSTVILQRDDCAPLVQFAEGYLWQQKATTLRGDDRVAALAKAQQLYASVVQAAPKNGPAFNNLAVVESSLLATTRDEAKRTALIDSATAHWRAAEEGDPRQLAKYAVDLGDFLMRAGKRPEGLQVFEEASARTDSDLIRRRIVEHADLISPPQLFTTCQKWRAHYQDVAIGCYQSVLERSYLSSPSLARDALTGWAYLLAHNDQMSMERLSSLPKQWSDDSLVELRNFWSNPLNGFRRSGYWLSDPRRAAFAAEFVTKGCNEVAQGAPTRPKDAMLCMEQFVETQPELLDRLVFSAGNQPIDEELASILSLYRQLLSAYARNPELVQPQKSEYLIDRIFEGKGQAIVRRNWRVTQDFHAMLAAVYMERGIWSGPGAANALYQLKAVIDDGNKLAASSGGALVSSLPDIQQLLAKAYLMAAQKGTEASRKGLEQQAAAAYLEAVKGYLDYDALESAKAALGDYAKLNSPVGSANQIRAILQLRQDPSKLTASSLDQAHMPALFQPTDAVSKAFLARQRFKILGDISASEKRAEAERLDAALRAYQTTVDQKVTLLGTADVLRWQQTENRLLAAANSAAPPRIVTSTESVTLPNNGVIVNLPGERRPAYIALSTQTENTAKLVQKVGAADIVRIRKYLYLQNGEILVMHNDDPAVRKVEDFVKVRAIT